MYKCMVPVLKVRNEGFSSLYRVFFPTWTRLVSSHPLTHVHTHSHMYTPTTYVHTHHTCTHPLTHVHTHSHMYTHMYVHAHSHMYTPTTYVHTHHTCTHPLTHVHTHTLQGPWSMTFWITLEQIRILAGISTF